MRGADNEGDEPSPDPGVITVRPSVHGDVVRLSQRSEHERLYNVEVLVKSASAPEAPRSGPAQVATDAYRANWEAIFGARSKGEGSDAPN